jgi:hypothetical protein
MSGGRAQKSTFHLKEESNEFLESLVTGEETWVNYFTPQMKQAERQGKHAISPTVKKFSECLSVCWKSWSICNLGCIGSHPLGTQRPMHMPTATCCDHYVRQFTEDLDMSQGVIPQHNNATPHSAYQTQKKLQMFQ